MTVVLAHFVLISRTGIIVCGGTRRDVSQYPTLVLNSDCYYWKALKSPFQRQFEKLSTGLPVSGLKWSSLELRFLAVAAARHEPPSFNFAVARSCWFLPSIIWKKPSTRVKNSLGVITWTMNATCICTFLRFRFSLTTGRHIAENSILKG